MSSPNKISSPSKLSPPGPVPHSDPILFSDDEIHSSNQMLTSDVGISGGNDGTSPDATQTGEPSIPKVVVLIGQTAEPFLIPVVSLTNLSQRFADYVLIRLPTKHYTCDVNDKELVKDEAIVWEQMDIPMFQLLGDFQLRRDYSVPILAKPLDQQTGDPEARSEFAQRAENVNTVLLWSEWLNHLNLDIDRMVRPFYGDFLEEFGADIIANPNPPDTSFEDFLPHAKLYMLSVRFDIVGLGELALKKLTILVLRAHLTFDFAGAFAQLVRFVLLNTGKDDALRKRIYKIRTLVVNLFMKNPKFAAVFEEFREFSNEIMYMRVAQ